jgi:hypothetical protein
LTEKKKKKENNSGRGIFETKGTRKTNRSISRCSN